MAGNMSPFNERIGRRIDDVFSILNILVGRSLKKCHRCGKWVKSVDRRYLCPDCVLEEKREIYLKLRQEIEKPTILYVYDTSWLMDPKDYGINAANDYNIQHIILDSVKKEINNHLHGDNEDKKINAGHARTIVSEFMAKDGYTEYNESEIIKMNIGQEILGPDSKTDLLILSFANQHATTLSDEGPSLNSVFVFIYTHDGGIKTESVNLFKKHKQLVFTQSSIASFNKLLGETADLISAKINEEWQKKYNS